MSTSTRWRVFRVYLLMWGIHFGLSLIAHCGLIWWYAVNPGSASQIAADGSRFLSLSVGLPTYPVRTHLPLTESDASILATVVCIPIDCSVFALLYTWTYLAVFGIIRRSKGDDPVQPRRGDRE